VVVVVDKPDRRVLLILFKRHWNSFTFSHSQTNFRNSSEKTKKNPTSVAVGDIDLTIDVLAQQDSENSLLGVSSYSVVVVHH
jgi:hypothetical protein